MAALRGDISFRYLKQFILVHFIFTQNTENRAINLFWQKGEFQDVDLRPAELWSAPDSIKLCNRQLDDDYAYYMSPNTNVTRICDWATANPNPWYLTVDCCFSGLALYHSRKQRSLLYHWNVMVYHHHVAEKSSWR